MGDGVMVGVVSAASAALGVGLKAGFDWLSERVKARAPATIAASQAAYTDALTKQTEAFISALQENRQHLEEKVENLEAKVAEGDAERVRLRERVAELEAENERCIGEGRGMSQRLESLEAYLRRSGIKVPERQAATGLIELSGGKTTVLIPTHEKRPARPPRRRGRVKKETP